MNVSEIIQQVGRERRVENAITRYLHIGKLSPALEDVAQNIYLTLLEYPEYMITDLWEHQQLNFLIIGIVRRQLSRTGPYGWAKEKAKRFESIDGMDFIDNDTTE